jgi:NAD(P)-dependent dehydrogenase (short-subunit alcohol dehydrogenase family)
MRQDLSGRVVAVTGAARGIGAAAARLVAARGARLALLGLEPDRLAALATKLGGFRYAERRSERNVTGREPLALAVGRSYFNSVSACRPLAKNCGFPV